MRAKRSDDEEQPSIGTSGRRRFLTTLGVASAGVGALAVGCGDDDGRSPPDPPPVETTPPPMEPAPRAAMRFFTDAHQADTMDAVFERLLPGGDGIPGARQTGVLNFTDAELAKPHFQAFGRFFRDALVRLDAHAQSEHQKTFLECSEEERDGLLSLWQRNQGPRGFPSGRFFMLAQTFALEGWLGDPRHGGNHEKRTWRWLGFDLMCGQNMFRCGQSGEGEAG